MQTLSLLFLPLLLVVLQVQNPEEIFSFLQDTSQTPTTARTDSLKEGDPAPTFVLRDLKTDDAVYLRDYTGKTLRNRSHQRQVVVLSFWSTWCEPCKVEIPQLTKLAGEFGGKPAKFFLINTMEAQSTTEDSVKAVYASRGYTLQCLLDVTGRVATRYTAHSLPLVVVIDKEGTVRKVVRGFREGSYAEFAEFVKHLIE